MFQPNLSFQSNSLFQSKNKKKFKMGILTELLPMTNLLIPPPNPAHTPEEEEGLPQQDYCWRFISWWGILVLITNDPWWLSHSIGVWYTLGSRVRTSNRELKMISTRSLPPFLFLFFIVQTVNVFNNTYIFYNFYFQFQSVLLETFFYQDFKLLLLPRL